MSLSPHMQLGKKLEDLALKYYLSKNYTLKYQRYKTPFAEIDLIFISPTNHLVLVEVKSQPRKGFEAFRVSQKQKNRLRRAHLSFTSHSAAVESHLAIVSQDGRVEIYKDYLAY